MSNAVVIHLSDEALRVAREYASALNSSTDEYLSQQAEQHLLATTDEKSERERRFRRFFGCVNSGDPHASDNERIDADLAREYGR